MSRRKARPEPAAPAPRAAFGPAARLLALAAAGATLLVGAGGWWRARGEVQVRRQPGLSVLLITVDTLRSDALGAYGNAGAVTPWIDRLAAAGVRFEAAHAHNVVTLPSHANILSGRYPQDHGVRDNAGFRFPPQLDTLATLLEARGYVTGAFVSAFPLDSRFGLSRGFDVYDDRFVDADARPAFLVQERRGSETVALARRWLEAQAGRPSFCWVHVYEPHFPYEPPEPYASRFRGDPYHGEVAAADAALGPLLEPILAAGESGRTLVVLTADHGESLGEHGEATHGIFAYEATLAVPLILYQPRLLRPRVVSEPARHVDLLPTILDALALPAAPDLPGRSLLPIARGAAAGPTTSYFEALSGALDRGWAPLHGVIRDQTKYVELPLPELYDLRGDPRESRNLAAAQPARLDLLRALLVPLLRADRRTPRAPESAETRERLKSLGYLNGGPGHAKERYTAADDPKRLMELDALLQEVVGHYAAGDLPGALGRCRELVRRRPGMAVSLLHLAHLERASGDLAAGVAALRKAVALDPENTTAIALLGTYLIQAGAAREAAQLLEPYARRDPADLEVLTAASLAQARLGQTADALATLVTARAQFPASALVLLNLGAVQLTAGDRAAARAAFDGALALNPNVARAHSSLGVLAAEDGRAQEAVEHWTRAVALDPRECGKLLELAALLRGRGRAAEARPYLELFVASAPRALYARQIDQVQAWLGSSAP